MKLILFEFVRIKILWIWWCCGGVVVVVFDYLVKELIIDSNKIVFIGWGVRLRIFLNFNGMCCKMYKEFV